jgi:CPA2 family monovalent cation:H+ antiporter-2
MGLEFQLFLETGTILFLACIIAMSSVAITIKIMEEIKKANRPETEILISLMIVEDFASIILLTTVSTLVICTKTSAYSMVLMFAGIIVMFSLFVILSFIILPKVLPEINKMMGGEGFILFALGIVAVPLSMN